MAGWQVQPDKVGAITDSITESAKPIATALEKLPDDIQEAAVGTASAEVAQALQRFVEAHQPGLQLIADRIPAVLQGVVDATNAVLAGDDEMAMTAQAAFTSLGAADIVQRTSSGLEYR
jgi:hypothetical protein